MTTPPRIFFENYVRRSYNEWLAAPKDEYLAKNAVTHANIMAERMWDYYETTAPHRVYCARRAEGYRGQLGDVCPDFALVRDVAEGFKHVELSRPGRQVTRADQTALGSIGFGEGGFGEGLFGGAEEMVIGLDDGSKRALAAVMANVVALWDRLTAI